MKRVYLRFLFGTLLVFKLSLVMAASEPKETPPPEYPVEFRVDFGGEPEVSGNVILVLNSDDRPQVVDEKKPYKMDSAPLSINLGSASSVVTSTLKFKAGAKSATVFVRGSEAPACRASSSAFKPDPVCIPAQGDQQCGSIAFNSEKTPKVTIFCGKKASAQ